jgi:hypothetical protein
MRAFLERAEASSSGVYAILVGERTTAVVCRERGLVRWRTAADPRHVLTKCGRYALHLARQSDAKRAARHTHPRVRE